MKNQSVPLFILFISFLCCLSAAEAAPTAQSDLYMWKWPYKTPTITPYDAIHPLAQKPTFADEHTAQQMIERTKKDLSDQCPNLESHHQYVEQYSLGKDGVLLVVLCRSDIQTTESVYYRKTLKNRIKRLTFRVPQLDNTRFASKAPKIVGYEETDILKNSYIDQKRLISKDMFLSDTLDHTRKEWIWKKGHGFVLHTQTYARIRQKGEETFVLFPQHGQK